MVTMTTAEPRWLAEARLRLGTREVSGLGNNPAIMRWAKNVSKWLGITYAGDSVPWCGLFVAECVVAAGLTPPKMAVRASSWSAWGIDTAPRIGCVLVFKRPGGGHVGFYVAEDATTYHVLGGNQSDAVTITRIAKDRKVASRWPAGKAITTKPFIKQKTGGAISENEA